MAKTTNLKKEARRSQAQQHVLKHTISKLIFLCICIRYTPFSHHSSLFLWNTSEQQAIVYKCLQPITITTTRVLKKEKSDEGWLWRWECSLPGVVVVVGFLANYSLNFLVVCSSFILYTLCLFMNICMRLN